MSTMIRWSPSTSQLHHHHHHHRDINDWFQRFFEGPADQAAADVRSWLPAVEGWVENGTYVIQFALPGVDPKGIEVSWMGNVLTVKGERTSGPDATGKDYFVREVEYGAFQRSFDLPEGVDAAQVEAKCTNGVLEVRVPAPRVATSRTIEVKAA